MIAQVILALSLKRSCFPISSSSCLRRLNRVGWGQRGKEADVANLDFKDLFPFYFSSIFFISFFTSTELGLGFPRRAWEMDGSLQGVQGRGLRPARGGGEGGTLTHRALEKAVL